MSLRTTERLLITSAFALLLAAGCGDGDSAPAMDAGKMDAGKPDAGKDTGVVEEDSISCGSKQCTGVVVQNTTINPCCVPETNGCGLDAADLKRANSSTPFTGCVPKDVPAAVDDSVYCGEFWDQVEMVKKDNGGLDIASGAVTLTFQGCCLPTGECGAKIDTPINGDPDVVNTHLGCVSFGRLQTAFASSGDAGPMEEPANLPFCNPSTGEPVDGVETVPGVPNFVCGCGKGVVYNAADKSQFRCLSNLPTTVCGADEPTADYLAMVPEFICGGCSPASRLPCLRNNAATTCGSKQIDANSDELLNLPVFICGAGTSTTPSALPTLPGVDASVCGKKLVPAGSTDLAAVPAFICGEMGNPDTVLPKLRNLPATTCGTLSVANGSPYLAQVPEFLCGCTAANAATGFPCLRNLTHSTCGSQQIAAGNTRLGDLPEYLCGCGPDTVDPQTSLTCLSHVETNVCGGIPVTSAAALAAVPKVLCGCGNDVVGARCLPNVPANLCGTADATASLAGLPDSLCGCGENVLAGPRPCLNNLPITSCGGLDVPTSQLTYLPASLCGCGPTVTYDPGNTAVFSRPCLSKTAYNECGGGTIGTSDPNTTPSNTADDCFTGIDSFVRGCGEGVAENTAARTCLPNGKNTLWGCNFPAVGQTIPGQPTYACGCGVGAFPQFTPAECIPNTAYNACGSVAPIAAQLAALPTYLCGCGASGVLNRQSATSTAAPCLSNLAASVCGTGTAVNTPYLGRLPASVCGCGGTTTYALSATAPPCLSNQASTVCGTLPVPTTTRTSPLPACYTGWPEYVRGCGSATLTYPWTCVPNGATTSFGCIDIPAAAAIATQPAYLCGCGENVGPASDVPCLPNVSIEFCGGVALSTALVPQLPNSLCGCDPDTGDSTVVKWNPLTAPSAPCISTLSTATCGQISPCGPAGTAGNCSSGLCTDTNADGVGNICQ